MSLGVSSSCRLTFGMLFIDLNRRLTFCKAALWECLLIQMLTLNSVKILQCKKKKTELCDILSWNEMMSYKPPSMTRLIQKQNMLLKAKTRLLQHCQPMKPANRHFVFMHALFPHGEGNRAPLAMIGSQANWRESGAKKLKSKQAYWAYFFTLYY